MTKAKRRIRMGIFIISIALLLCIAVILVCNLLVVNNAKGKTFSEIDSIRPTEVGLLLGTTPQTHTGNLTNYFFVYRIDAAEQLYKAGKIEKILISGDENSLDGVDEPQCMRDSLVARGVPASAIIMDGKGYRTICSIINANKVYGLKDFIIISQEFHNERALYLAEHLGLDIENIQAYNAKDPNSTRALKTYIREYFARVKMFWDLFTYKESDYYYSNTPTIDMNTSQDMIRSFLGKPIIMNDFICEQIAAIAEQDTMLSYGDSILQIGDVKWRINIIPNGVALLTSVQPDDPKMKQVDMYLNRIYGKPYDDEEDGFSIKWSSSEDSLGRTLVHLRRVHSEEGGTFLFFY
ncbi:MAG: YdcF family protein [Prevotella sp.]|nr:YdcF family protein [Prevotella sp.]